MADGDIVRKITISATGENIDSTTNSTLALGTATAALTTATIEQTKRAADAEDAYRGQANALDKDTESHKTFGGVVKSAAQYTLEAAAAYYAKTAAIRVAIAATTLIVGVLFELYLAYKLVTGVIGLVTDAWRLGGEELKKYTDLAKNATASNTAVEYFQRITKAAAEAKLTTDELTASLKKVNESTELKLGGSDATKRTDELVKNGNFVGNTGVDALKTANSTEEKLKALSSLYDQAIAKGERLAALDVMKTVAGDAVAQNLAKNSSYLKDMLKSADAIAANTLVSAADVANAVSLRDRLAAAEKLLSERWHPIQNILISLGVQMRAIWVSIVEAIASAVDWAAKLITKLSEAKLPPQVVSWLNRAAASDMENSTPEETRAKEQVDPLDLAKINSDNYRGSAQFAAQMKEARQRLAVAMHREFDRSKPLDKPETAGGEKKDAFDLAKDQLQKYIEVTKAAAISIDYTAGEQEKLKAIAQLTAAGLKDGLTPEAAKAKAELSGMGKAAGDAAMALEKAKVASAIKFGRNTALLSPEDAAIASQLKLLYPDVATALNSVEAQGLRTNAVLSGLSSQMSGQLTTSIVDVLDGTKSLATGAADMGKIFVRAIEEMIVKLLVIGPLMRALQSGLSGGINLTGVGFNPIAGISGHAAGTDSSPGGWHWVGENGPELMNVPKGAKVLPNGVMPDGGGISAPVSIHIDATGADAAGLARVQQQLASLQRTLPATIVTTVKKAKTNRVL